jgi:hypothetical protein
MSAPVNKNVTSTQSEIVASNTSRTKLTIQNNSGANVFLGENNTVTTSNGYRLDNGTEKIWERTKENDEFFYTGALHAIAASGTNAIIVWEELKGR